MSKVAHLRKRTLEIHIRSSEIKKRRKETLDRSDTKTYQIISVDDGHSKIHPVASQQ